MHNETRNENWDDIRFVLAVADTGTVSAAARRLGVNHATVLRRVAAFETRHDAEVFERTSTGYRVRPERARLIEAAREVGQAVQSVETLLRGNRAPLTGNVRISSTDTFCLTVLPPIVEAFHNDVTGLSVSLISTNAYSDFSRAHADLAVRPTSVLSDDMTGEIAAQCGFGVYACPERPIAWLGLAGHLARAPVSAWASKAMPAERIVGAADSFPVLAKLARQGLGRVVLPCCLGDPDPGLVRLDTPGDVPSLPLWVAWHVDMDGVSRIRATGRYLLEALAARSEQLAGVSG